MRIILYYDINAILTISAMWQHVVPLWEVLRYLQQVLSLIDCQHYADRQLLNTFTGGDDAVPSRGLLCE